MYREEIYKKLLELHKIYGGYYGTDIAKIANEYNVTISSMQVNFCRWRSSDVRFSCLNYLGKRRPNYSLREFIPALNSLSKNILARPILFLDDMNYNRKAENLPPISKSSFFKVLNDIGFSEVSKKHRCRIGYYEINEFQKEKLAANRKALSDLFTLRDSLDKKDLYINNIFYKFKAANNWFNENYSVNPYYFFEKVHPKMTFLWAFFLILKHGEAPDFEAQLIFEIQALFLIDCVEILSDFYLSDDYKTEDNRNNFFEEYGDVSPEEIHSYLVDLSNQIKNGRKKQNEPLYPNFWKSSQYVKNHGLI